MGTAMKDEHGEIVFKWAMIMQGTIVVTSNYWTEKEFKSHVKDNKIKVYTRLDDTAKYRLFR